MLRKVAFRDYSQINTRWMALYILSITHAIDL